MNTIQINIEEGFALLTGVLLKTLKKNGWSREEVERRHKEIYLECCEAIEQAKEPIAQELAAYVAEIGFDETALQGLVRTEFALRGFDLANTLSRRRQALCN